MSASLDVRAWHPLVVDPLEVAGGVVCVTLIARGFQPDVCSLQAAIYAHPNNTLAVRLSRGSGPRHYATDLVDGETIISRESPTPDMLHVRVVP